MRYSLPSRDIIADSMESMTIAQCHDASILIPNCDKNMPGCLMSACRSNRPTLIVYGGTISSGHHKIDVPGMNRKKGDPSNIADNFEAAGAFAMGKITNEERLDIVRNSCPGEGES